MKYVIIKSKTSGLVLDASDTTVKIQNFNGLSPNQLWKLENATSTGTFFIVNKSDGNVLDIKGEVTSGAELTTNRKKNGNLKQQWYINSDNTIVNAGEGFAVDIYRGSLTAGTKTALYEKHGGANQQFIFVEWDM